MSVNFHEEWFSEASCEVVAGYAASVTHLDGLFVEIGSWEGRSTVAIANAIAPRRLDAVDTWWGSAGEISEELARERDVFAQFQMNIAALTAGNVLPWRMDWRVFMAKTSDPLAFVFIDALHTYAEVMATIATIRPRMAPGGVVCGDDVHHQPIQQALAESFDPQLVEVKASLWCWRVPA